ncbi:DUF4926 domain-containing protein [uncultured Imperialibacter sp.]|mgnify:FL=1|uniref:DUF4926 domain-containing protein n=1 Tax=uncultured Imperialibacter sp. TaxID=1672639 RepID=UPI0030DC9F20|tara:strand:- start:780 stop:1004 length:225 start_codon:yes stop_codon:yes gene_type:complete
MIENFDRVVLKVDLPERGLKKGDIGTVVMIHDNRKGYEVEFFTLMGKTRSVESLKANKVRPVKANEVAHSREIA